MKDDLHAKHLENQKTYIWILQKKLIYVNDIPTTQTFVPSMPYKKNHTGHSKETCFR